MNEFTGRGGITAKVIAHSAHPVKGKRGLITFQLRYPRFIHAECKTHRVFRIAGESYESIEDVGFMNDPNLSRNASSSRAIPVAKMIEQVRNDPAMPIHWGKNQPGMQAREELVGQDRDAAIERWLLASSDAVRHAEHMNALGAHKQVVNRILEPFQFMSVIVTATEWENFFLLREHGDADPNICELAKVMKRAIAASKPKQLAYGDWHLPYVTAVELANIGVENARRASAARCARVSYLTHDGKAPKLEDDLALYDRLIVQQPMHASPIEHQATADQPDFLIPDTWANRDLWGNLSHWIQNRKVVERGLAQLTATLQ